MENIVLQSNKYVLAYRAEKVIINSLFEASAEKPVFIGYDLTGVTSYELFDNEIDMQNRIAELFPSVWKYPDLQYRFILPLTAVIEKYSAKITELKDKGAPYEYINKWQAVVVYTPQILPEDLPILEADPEVIIEIYSDYVANN